MNKKTITYLVAIGLVLLQLASAAADVGILVEITSTSFLPAIIHTGDVVSLAVDIRNRGSTISIVDLNATLDVGSQFEPIEPSYYIDTIKPGSTKTAILKFRVKEGTPPGYYPVFLAITYLRVDELVSIEQTVLVPVSQTETNIDVTIDPRVINPGKPTDVVFAIKNVGGTPVSNLSFSWNEESDLVLPLGSGNKRYLPILEAGKQEEVSYTIAADPNIAPGVYPLDITLTFTDVNGTKTQTFQVGIIIGGTTDFEVSAEMLSTGQLSISIANIGSNNAGAAVVRIPPQPAIEVSGSNIAILGNLNKGEFTIANFQIKSTAFDQNRLSRPREGFAGGQAMGGQAPQDDKNLTMVREARQANVLVIEIDYTDTTGERQSVQKTVQLSQTFSETLGGTAGGRLTQGASVFSFVPWVLLVLIVAGAISFNRFRAGRRSWKRLAKVLAAIIVLFLATIYLLGSSLLAVAAAGIVSLVLLAWFFRGNRVVSAAEQGTPSYKKQKE